ncbi:hypothetical protein QAD02_004177 [Eretmocerus hayati]|uniref:Uncharacterized protein n=1 Tax=Eretmocerus hayati TaxID=131215 RepID=A0ACC2NPU8_9HYME|nr:hypothetical protein QAD02_004177 [Eretmocerus hayati]
MVVAQCLQTERCSDISSSLCFSCAMMGLQATTGKRKLDGGVGCMDFDMEIGESPSKIGRIENSSWWSMDDSSYSSNSPTALNQPTSAAYYELDSSPSCLQSSASTTTLPSAWAQHHHYEPPTIRREENGKSYLELGSSYRANERCCEGSPLSWCRRGRACYRQRRLAVFNVSMCKLASS